MRLFVDPVFVTAACASLEELDKLNRILTFDQAKKWGEEEAGIECLYRTDNTFYTGLLDFVLDRLKESGVEVEVVFRQPNLHEPLALSDLYATLTPDLLPGITLREYQYDAALRMLHHRRGVVRVPTAGGKTEISQAVFRYLLDRGLATRTLYLVEASGLFKQAVRRFKSRGFEVGTYTSEGLDRNDANVVVGMVPSISSHLKSGRVDLTPYQALIADEAHHVAANRWTQVLENCPAPFRYGMSATPTKMIYGPTISRDYRQMGLLGDIVYNVSASYLIERGHIALPIVTFLNVTRPHVLYSVGWQAAYKRGIVCNEYFHRLVAAVSHQMAILGHRVLVLVFELDHGESILRALKKDYGYEGSMFSGDETLHTWEGEKLKARSASIDHVVAQFNDQNSFVLVGTPAIGEGVDLPSASCVIPAFGGKDYKNTLQAVGRGMRPKLGENVVYVFDFVHYSHPSLLKHSRERRDTYLAMEYEVQDGLDALVQRGISLQLP